MGRTSSLTSETGLVAHVTSNDLFKDLDESTLRALEAELEQSRLSADEVLFQQGAPGDSMYVLVRGHLGVQIKLPDGSETVVGELGSGESVGEMALLTGQARTATVYALTDAELVKLSKAGFDRIAEKYPHVITEFARTIIPRMRGAQLAGVLTGLFGEIDATTLHDLQAKLEWRHLSSGETLFRQGDAGDAMYVVVNGRLGFAIEREDGSESKVGEVCSGDVVGEFALLTDEPRSATVYAIRDTDAVRLSRAVFEELIERYPQIMVRIARNIIKHGQQVVRASTSESVKATTFTLAPTHRSVPLSIFARRLAAALATFGPTLHLSDEHFDRYFGKPGAAQTAEDHPTNVTLVAWLSEQETKYRYIIYETNATWSPWTRRCLRQADRILLVGEADADPTPGEIEIAMRHGMIKARVELVLLQPNAIEQPVGTSKWLEWRQVRAHHHVRMKVGEDFQRLARRLTDRALGLTLSGGGARGLAHIGVIRALREAGLPIDLIGGTSMGSLVAAGYAMGWDDEAMHQLVTNYFSAQQLMDYTLPLVSFFASKKLTNVLRTLFQDVQIEDLWQPFFCVSCNLTQGTEVIHQKGPVWRAVRASVAVPGAFSPILDEDDMLVDGGVINNFPIDAMRELCGNGIVIGVNASPAKYKTQQTYQFGTSISGWQVLWNRLNPFTESPPMPSILGNIMRVLDVNGLYRERLARDLADLIIQLPVEEFGTLEFEPHDEIVEIGYRTTQQALEMWRRDR